jgi:hypothetical protein
LRIQKKRISSWSAFFVISGVRKGKQPELILKLTDETAFLGVKECKEITVGAVVFARYLEKDKENIAVRVSVRPMRIHTEKGAEGKKE